jgi:hypothetical protein
VQPWEIRRSPWRPGTALYLAIRSARVPLLPVLSAVTLTASGEVWSKAELRRGRSVRTVRNPCRHSMHWDASPNAALLQNGRSTSTQRARSRWRCCRAGDAAAERSERWLFAAPTCCYWWAAHRSAPRSGEHHSWLPIGGPSLRQPTPTTPAGRRFARGNVVSLRVAGGHAANDLPVERVPRCMRRGSLERQTTRSSRSYTQCRR